MINSLRRLAPFALAAALLACRQPDRTPIVETVRLPPLGPTATATLADSIRQLTAPPRWPIDTFAYGVSSIDSLKLPVPQCGESAIVSGDSIGSVTPGLTADEVVGRCPGALALWDLKDAGTPSPVYVVQMKSARFVLSFEDTLGTSKLVTISTSDSTARTSAGVGPGMLFSEVRKIHGIPGLDAAGCVLVATFHGAPGLSFHLDTGRFIKCTDVPIIVRDNAVERLPPTTSIKRLVISQPSATGVR